METTPTAWIRALAQPYLHGYRALAASPGEGLRGWWFLAPGPRAARTGRAKAGKRNPRANTAPQIGFFVGYLTDSTAFAFLPCNAPECGIFAFVQPATSAAHRGLVRAEGALVRRTFTYIRWLTHRPPRFQFFERELPALIRHRPLNDFPAERHEHFSRNFFIETLAWLVRSGLVRKLAEETGTTSAAKGSKRNVRRTSAKGKKKSRHAA
jgi:hypothetical protein